MLYNKTKSKRIYIWRKKIEIEINHLIYFISNSINQRTLGEKKLLVIYTQI